MFNTIVYSDSKKLDKLIRGNKFIPYRISDVENAFEIGKRYFIYYWDSSFKVLSKEKSEDIELGYCVKWDDNKYGMYNTNIDPVSDYLLEPDSKNLHNINIINDDNEYTGAEIVYWFYIHNINYFNKQYKGFWKFLDRSSIYRISDNKKYKLYAEVNEKGKYINCRILRTKNTSRV